jgi:predicted ester cyclase
LSADVIARGYALWSESSDRSVFDHFSPEFFDNVSGEGGLAIFDVVGGWLEASFADRRVEIHATMSQDDRIITWFTMHGVHIGNGFPRLAGLPVAGRTVAWSQVHIFRVANGEVVEHWAVRDDLALLEQIRNAAS